VGAAARAASGRPAAGPHAAGARRRQPHGGGGAGWRHGGGGGASKAAAERGGGGKGGGGGPRWLPKAPCEENEPLSTAAPGTWVAQEASAQTSKNEEDGGKQDPVNVMPALSLPLGAQEDGGKQDPVNIMQVLHREVQQLFDSPNVTAAAPSISHINALISMVDNAQLPIDGHILAMAAGSCRRLRLRPLVEKLCTSVHCYQLATHKGHAIAEMAQAAMELDFLCPVFFEAVATCCTLPEPDTFMCLSDVIAAVRGLLVSAKVCPAIGVDYTLALHGLACATLPILVLGSEAAAILAEFTLMLASALGLRPLGGGPPLCETPVVGEVMRRAIERLRCELLGASSCDVTMAACVARAAWPYMQHLMCESELQLCLQDVAEAARFKRQDFNTEQISIIAGAFAAVERSDPIVAGLLAEQTRRSIGEFSTRELCLLLWAADKVPGWLTETFAANAAAEFSCRDLSAVPVSDLCSSAETLAKLDQLGLPSLRRIASEVSRRDLHSFAGVDRATLLWALAKSSVHYDLQSELACSLAPADVTWLEGEAAAKTLWALGKVWTTAKFDSPDLKTVVAALCRQWNYFSGSTLDASWALSRLSASLECKVHEPGTSSSGEACFPQEPPPAGDGGEAANAAAEAQSASASASGPSAETSPQTSPQTSPCASPRAGLAAVLRPGRGRLNRCGGSFDEAFRLNDHCPPGHSVQMKNTFLHVNAAGDEALELRQTRSTDDLLSLAARHDSVEADADASVPFSVSTVGCAPGAGASTSGAQMECTAADHDAAAGIASTAAGAEAGARPLVPRPPRASPASEHPSDHGYALRVDWDIDVLESQPQIVATTVKLRVVGGHGKLFSLDAVTGRLVARGGRAVPMPATSAVVVGIEEGVDYEAVVAFCLEGCSWSEDSPPSDPVCVGARRPVAKPPVPEAPRLVAMGGTALKCSWTIPCCFPPVEAITVRLLDVNTKKGYLVDADTARLVPRGGSAFLAPACEVVLQGVPLGAWYVGRVIARSALGFSDQSPQSTPEHCPGHGSEPVTVAEVSGEGDCDAWT